MRWTGQRRDLLRRVRRYDGELRRAGCERHWQVGERCFVTDRLMSRAEVEQEKARLMLRAAHLQRLLTAQ